MSDYANNKMSDWTASARVIYCKDCKHFNKCGCWCEYQKNEAVYNSITGIESIKKVDDVSNQLVKIVGKDKALIYDLCAQKIFNKDNDCKLFEQKEFEKKSWWSRLWR